MALDDLGPDLSCFDFADSDPDEEGRDQMLKRHQQEMQQLQADFKAKKKHISKTDKEARKAIDIQLAEAQQLMEERHTHELGECNSVHGVQAAGRGSTISKQAKRKQKKDLEERERDRRISEEKAGAAPSAREIEMNQMAEQLAPLGLQVKDISADGHCLYRAVAHQLQLRNASSCDYLACRSTAAAYMRSHPADFEPFIEGSSLSTYAQQVESSNEWGGHLEISALSHANKCTIVVFSAMVPVVVVGEEYSGNGPRLELSYHKHYYGLGEHYNSLVPLLDD